MIFPRDNQQHGAARTVDPLVFLRTVRRKQAAKQIAAGVRYGKMENAGHHIENRLLPFRRFYQGQLRNIHPRYPAPSPADTARRKGGWYNTPRRSRHPKHKAFGGAGSPAIRPPAGLLYRLKDGNTPYPKTSAGRRPSTCRRPDFWRASGSRAEGAYSRCAPDQSGAPFGRHLLSSVVVIGVWQTGHSTVI